MDTYDAAESATRLFGKNAACAARPIATNLGLPEFVAEAEALSERYLKKKDDLVRTAQRSVDAAFEVASVTANRRAVLLRWRGAVGIAMVLAFIASSLAGAGAEGSTIDLIMSWLFYALLVAFLAMCIAVWVSTGTLAKQDQEFDAACRKADKDLADLYLAFAEEDIALSGKALDAYLDTLASEERERLRARWEEAERGKSVKATDQGPDPTQQAVRERRRRLGRLSRRSEMARDLAEGR